MYVSERLGVCGRDMAYEIDMNSPHLNWCVCVCVCAGVCALGVCVYARVCVLSVRVQVCVY